MMTSKQVQSALLWLKEVFETHQIEFQIVGGLAANMHGGSRDVADIDLYIAKSDAQKILPFVRPYISKPLGCYVEGAWDLEYLQLMYQDQKIEIGLSPGTRIRDAKSGKWIPLDIDYSQSVSRNYAGIVLPTIPVADLIRYKSALGRDVDLIDVTELTTSAK